MKQKTILEKRENKFHDVGRFPSEEGHVLFPISMSRISNTSQNAKKYLKYIEHLNEKIPKTTSVKAKVGGVFIYTESLYLNSSDPSNELKSRLFPLMNSHKNAMINLISRHKIFIQDAFSYISWAQLYINYNGDFTSDLGKLKKLYKKDKLLQKYLREDFSKLDNKKYSFDENQINFFLEEHLMVYLLQKGKITIPNNFINGHEKWILMTYPGKPLKAQVYIFQLNPLNLSNPKNKYENSYYDLDEKKLYKYTEINLEAYTL